MQNRAWALLGTRSGTRSPHGPLSRVAYLRAVPWDHQLLFLIYVNAMPSLVKYGRLLVIISHTSQVLQFADDTTLICTGDNRDEIHAVETGA